MRARVLSPAAALGAMLLAALLLGACSVPPATVGGADATVTPSDATTSVGLDASAADAGQPVALRCECEQDETCTACFEHIGECCYEDRTLGGAVTGIIASCEGQPACKSCCNECAAATCDELKARNACPNI